MDAVRANVTMHILLDPQQGGGVAYLASCGAIHAVAACRTSVMIVMQWEYITDGSSSVNSIAVLIYLGCALSLSLLSHA